MNRSNLVMQAAAQQRLGIAHGRFAKLVRLGFLRPVRSGLFDLEELRRDYARACSVEARLAEGARGLILEEEHRAAIASVLERIREELATAPAMIDDPGQRQALEDAIAASLARVEIV